MADSATARIRDLNDHARQTITGCRVVVTRGIADLGDEAVGQVLAQVRTYDRFTPDNDPYGEHDFGSFHCCEHQVFWKWDYYDVDMSMHSPDPSDDTITTRVLTIMLADEY